MDEIRRVRLAAMSDPEYGVVALSKLRCEASRLVCARASLAGETSRIVYLRNQVARAKAQEIRRRRPAPRWFSREFAERSRTLAPLD